ncbi:hypothetical protein [Roseovarius aestuarii]|uniref:Uncharacterized protein n=1 Tax=Roseovarius aestuarii TaxID=475083 RepID=A0A1X7BLS5_9RHOB|nr:hypothetical protein [Roseovarius aestuarii]SMC10553.1 hypothetical protein ROA7745_00360 [Roseovarius aestuarii]
MPGQSTDAPHLFESRMQVINELSQENAELLRLLQRRSGHDILMMKDPDSQETTEIQHATDAALADCQTRIDDLESKLSRIDEQIEAAAKKEK